jgi:tRNA dimethylallyltransferase
VSIDAMAVYRGLDIGTETPRDSPAPWHLIDIADPSEDFSVAPFQAAGRRALEEIHGRDHLAVLVGGTGLYHRAVVDDLQLPGRYPEVAAGLEAGLAMARAPETGSARVATVAAHGRESSMAPSGTAGASGLGRLYERLAELDPLAASRIEPNNARRVVRALEVTLGSGKPYSSFGPGLEHYAPPPVRLVGLALDRRQIDRRLEERLEREMEEGFLEEVARLARREGGISRTARQAIGYSELLKVVEDGASLDQAKVAILRRLRSFARRQEAWFRRDKRVTWFPADAPDLAEAVLAHWGGTGAVSSWETRRS